MAMVVIICSRRSFYFRLWRCCIVNVPRNADGTFGTASWTNIAYLENVGLNTVYQNVFLGLCSTGGISFTLTSLTLPICQSNELKKIESVKSIIHHD